MMTNNIFEGAKFGDKFLTRDGKIARFICTNSNNNSCLYIDGSKMPVWFFKNGKFILEHKNECYIVSRYQESSLQGKVDERNPCDICRWKQRAENSLHMQSLSQKIDEDVKIMEEIIINNQLDEPCQLYKGEKMIGTIYNSTALNDVLVQLYLKEKEGIDVSEYYIMFKGQKLKRSKHNGRLLRVPNNFFNTDKENLAILFQLNE